TVVQPMALPEQKRETRELVPALVWPMESNPEHNARVQAITSENGQFLINGKPAERLQPAQESNGVVKETFVHTEDPGLLVRIYHSRSSLGAFERKNAKIESLSLLSAAGAAPKLIEHGEAAVEGLGRVYFYVQ